MFVQKLLHDISFLLRIIKSASKIRVRKAKTFQKGLKLLQAYVISIFYFYFFKIQG